MYVIWTVIFERFSKLCTLNYNEHVSLVSTYRPAALISAQTKLSHGIQSVSVHSRALVLGTSEHISSGSPSPFHRSKSTRPIFVFCSAVIEPHILCVTYCIIIIIVVTTIHC